MSSLKNKRHERFCQQYVKDHNGAQAYLRTGYKCSDDVARKNASRLLTNADVKKRVEELDEATKKRNNIEVDEIISGYREILRVGLKSYKIKSKSGKEIEVLVDAKNSKGVLDSMARIKSMFTDNLNLGFRIEDLIDEIEKEDQK